MSEKNRQEVKFILAETFVFEFIILVQGVSINMGPM